MAKELIWTGDLRSPLGLIRVGVSQNGLLAVHFPCPTLDEFADFLRAEFKIDPLAIEDDGWTAPVTEQLSAYFSGRLRRFDVHLDLRRSEFHRRALDHVARIPFGETRTYGQIALSLGRPHGARAVGLANSRNPVPIVIPCHRVIGANGQLTGYRQGLEAKRWLLRHEGVAIDRPPIPGHG